jgi:hypothetical protein
LDTGRAPRNKLKERERSDGRGGKKSGNSEPIGKCQPVREMPVREGNVNQYGKVSQ